MDFLQPRKVLVTSLCWIRRSVSSVGQHWEPNDNGTNRWDKSMNVIHFIAVFRLWSQWWKIRLCQNMSHYQGKDSCSSIWRLIIGHNSQHLSVEPLFGQNRFWSDPGKVGYERSWNMNVNHIFSRVKSFKFQNAKSEDRRSNTKMARRMGKPNRQLKKNNCHTQEG